MQGWPLPSWVEHPCHPQGCLHPSQQSPASLQSADASHVSKLWQSKCQQACTLCRYKQSGACFHLHQQTLASFQSTHASLLSTDSTQVSTCMQSICIQGAKSMLSSQLAFHNWTFSATTAIADGVTMHAMYLMSQMQAGQGLP